MKMCNKCEVEKPFSEFNKKKNGYQPYCRECDKAASKARYEANKESHIARVKRNRDKALQSAREYVLEYLVNHPCVDCGNSDVRVLEFDHVKGTKVDGIAKMVYIGYSIENLQKEIDKCEVRCANCHRIVTAERGNFWKSNYSPKV